MDRSEMLHELSRRAGVQDGTVRSVVDALLDLVHEGAVSPDILLLSRGPQARAQHPLRPSAVRLPIATHSEAHLVDDLIARARTHRLGVDFLVEGHLASVAAEFGAHAFTVEAARQRLKRERKDQSQG